MTRRIEKALDHHISKQKIDLIVLWFSEFSTMTSGIENYVYVTYKQTKSQVKTVTRALYCMISIGEHLVYWI